MSLRTRGSHTQTLQEPPAKKTSTQQPPTKKRKRLSCRVALLVVAAVLLAIYATPGLIIKYSLWVQSALIFVHHVRIPFYSNLTNPAEFGLVNTRNFDLPQYDGCAVSTWHVLPATYRDNVTLSRDYDRAMSDGAPIILYLHGNTGTRGTPHRVQLYQYLSNRGYHVVAFDYRGYGDSTCAPSERGLMEDSLLVWYWVRRHTRQSRIYIWGHSLGSTAATFLSQELWRLGSHPRGVVLDAPLTHMFDAAAHHPFGAPYWPIMPLFRYFVIEAFQEQFDSEARLKHIPYRILILHGHNDIIIPFHIGYQMYETALESRKRNPLLGSVHFVDCGETTHKTNYESPSLAPALDHFIDHK